MRERKSFSLKKVCDEGSCVSGTFVVLSGQILGRHVHRGLSGVSMNAKQAASVLWVIFAFVALGFIVYGVTQHVLSEGISRVPTEEAFVSSLVEVTRG